jgi:hypothetical protein
MEKYNSCVKCLRKKRKTKQQLCVLCKNYKNFKLAENLTELDINKLKLEAIDTKYRFEITQNNSIDLYDINTIIYLHERIFDIDYIGSHLKFGQQISLMWNNICKFILI